MSDMENNCLNCKHHYNKNLDYDDSLCDNVVICEKDNHYVGYFDEAENECCDFYAEE